MLAIIALLIELVLLSLNKALGAVYIDDLVAVFLILVFSISFLIAVQSSTILVKYSIQIISGYFLRIFLLFFDIFGTNIRTLPQSGNDSSMFFRTSSEIVLYGKTDRYNSFNFVVSRLFRIIGISKLYGQFLLMLLSIVAIILTITTFERLDISTSAKKYTSWIICLLPNFALLSSVFLRESTVTLLVTISACCMICWMQGGKGFFLFAALASSVLSCVFHSGCIGITIGCIVCLMVYDRKSRSVHVTLSGVLLSATIAFAASFVFIHYGDMLMLHFLGVQSVEDIANTSQLGGSSYARYVGNSDNPINMLVYTIPRIVYFLFSPFPWQWRGVADIIAFLFSGLYYLWTIKCSVVYLLKWDRSKSNKGLLIALITMVFFCTFIFAWGCSNTGTASRHRDKMVCIYSIILALSINDTNETNKSSLYFK